MTRKLTILLFFINIFYISNISAQIMTVNTALPTEVSDFKSHANYNIGAGGDLNLNFPLLNLSSRNNLDIALNLTYSAGIKVTQQASWVGLGWNLSVGSISRLPQGAQYYTCDFTGIPSSGSDIYMVNFPGHSGTMFAVRGADNLPKFVFESYKNWRVEYEIDGPVENAGETTGAIDGESFNAWDDFKSFTITIENGTRFLFEKALIGSGFRFSANHYNYIERFVNTWLLTSIESYDYEDTGTEGYDDNDNGSWIQISYKYDNGTDTHSEYYSDNTLHQNTYIDEILSPTHKLKFVTFDRSNEIYMQVYNPSSHQSGLYPQNFRGLDRIELYSTDDLFIKGWQFEYGSYTEGSEFVLFPSYGRNKLTLNAFYEYSATNQLPKYLITYQTENPGWADFIDLDQQFNSAISNDYWGYYRSSQNPIDASESWAWSIKSFTTPLGETNEFEFQNDHYTNSNLSFNVNRYEFEDKSYHDLDISFPDDTKCSRDNGGIRLKQVIVKQNTDVLKKVSYSYFNGRLTGMPSKYLIDVSAINYYGHMRDNFDRGQSRVVYPLIKIYWMDKNDNILGKKEEYYTTDVSDVFYNCEFNKIMLVIMPTLDSKFWYNIVQDNAAFLWGRLYKEVYYHNNDNNYDPVKEAEYIYEDQIIEHKYQYLDMGYVSTNGWSESIPLLLSSVQTELIQIIDSKYTDEGIKISTESNNEYNFETGMLIKNSTTNSDEKIRSIEKNYLNTPIGKNTQIVNGGFNDIPGLYEEYSWGIQYINFNYSPRPIEGWTVNSVLDNQSVTVDDALAGRQKVIHVAANNTNAHNTLSLTSDKIYIVDDRNYDLYTEAFLECFGNTPSAEIDIEIWTFDANDGLLNITHPSSYTLNTQDEEYISDYQTFKLYGAYAIIKIELDASGKSGDGYSYVDLHEIRLTPGEHDLGSHTLGYKAIEKNQLNLLLTESISSNSTLVEQKINEYDVFGPADDIIRLVSTKRWNDLDEDNSVDSNEKVPVINNIEYDNFGNPAEIKDAKETPTAYKWIYSGSLPDASFANGNYNETSFTSFENLTVGDFTMPEEDNRWWSYTNGGNTTIAISTEEVYSGASSLKVIPSSDITNSSGICLSSYAYENEFEIGKTYIISAWVKSNTNAYVDFSYNDGSDHYGVARDYHSGSGEWELLQTEYTVPSLSGSNWIKFHLQVNGVGTSHSQYAYYDDVLIYPAGAQVNYQSFDPSWLKVTSQSDANNNKTYYEYDDFGRIDQIKNDNKVVLTDYDYYYSRTENGDVFNQTDPNYVKVTSYADATHVQVTTNYYDGLGRTIQTQIDDGTNDLVTAVDYDELNRPVKNWKPYKQFTGHAYDPSYATNANSYYSATGSGPDAGGYAYNKTVYRNAFSDEIKEIGFPGSDFIIGSGHAIDIEYTTNNIPEYGYNPSTLFKTKTNDENNKDSYTYTDILGNTIAQKSNDGTLNINTAFQYDILGNLKKVIPPNAFNGDTPDYNSPYNTTYEYNTLNQMTQKETPDAGEVKYLYDKNSNLRFVRDANNISAYGVNSVFKNDYVEGTGGDSFTLNELGLVTCTIEALFSSGTATLVIKDANNNQVHSMSTTDLKTEYINLPCGNYSCVVTGNYCEYTLECKPIVFTYTKYDIQNRPIESGEYQGSSNNFSQGNADNTSFPNTISLDLVRIEYEYDDQADDAPESQNNLKGRLSKVEYVDDNSGTYGKTFYSYTPEGWIEWIIQDLPGEDVSAKKVAYEYDLQGKVIKMVFDAGGNDSYYFWYEYNNLGQLEDVYGSVNGTKPNETKLTYYYWPNGQLYELLCQKPGFGYASRLKYEYNTRDWLTNITSTVGNNFYEELYYNEPPSGTVPGSFEAQYNGNISVAGYYSPNPDLVDNSGVANSSWYRYVFNYDNINRLTLADAEFKNASGWSDRLFYNVYDLSYDRMGNIETLTRNPDIFSVGPTFDYKYEEPGTNYLTSVSGLNALNNYDYDANGNLIGDISKNISSGDIKYDHRNLPVRIDYNNDNTFAEYSYDNNGNRIYKKFVPDGSITPSASYYIYDAQGRTLAVYDKDGKLKFINLYGLELMGKIY